MLRGHQAIETALTLQVHEDAPFWRWAWLDDDLKVVSEGVAFSEAGACKVAGTVLETLAMLAASQGVGAATTVSDGSQPAALSSGRLQWVPPGWELAPPYREL